MTDWVTIHSSAIRRVGYDAGLRRLYIDFEDSNPTYTFCGVPESVYHGLISASSAGSYYHAHIKDRYDC